MNSKNAPADGARVLVTRPTSEGDAAEELRAARPEGRYHGRRALQETPQGRDRTPTRLRLSFQSRWSRCARKPRFPVSGPAGPLSLWSRSASRKKSPARSSRPWSWPLSSRSTRNTSLPRSLVPTSTSKRSRSRRASRSSSRWMSRSSPTSPCPDYKSLTAIRPVRKIVETDIDAQHQAVPRAATPRKSPSSKGAPSWATCSPSSSVSRRTASCSTGNARGQDPAPARAAVPGRPRPRTRQDPRWASVPATSARALAKIGTSSPDPALRGQTIQVAIRGSRPQELRIPDVDDAIPRLDRLRISGSVPQRHSRVSSSDALSSVPARPFAGRFSTSLSRPLPSALPPDLVRRQEQSTLRRMVFELRQERHDRQGNPGPRVRDSLPTPTKIPCVAQGILHPLPDRRG